MSSKGFYRLSESPNTWVVLIRWESFLVKTEGYGRQTRQLRTIAVKSSEVGDDHVIGEKLSVAQHLLLPSKVILLNFLWPSLFRSYLTIASKRVAMCDKVICHYFFNLPTLLYYPLQQGRAVSLDLAPRVRVCECICFTTCPTNRPH